MTAVKEAFFLAKPGLLDAPRATILHAPSGHPRAAGTEALEGRRFVYDSSAIISMETDASLHPAQRRPGQHDGQHRVWAGIKGTTAGRVAVLSKHSAGP